MDNERDRDPIVNPDSKSLKPVNNECDSRSLKRRSKTRNEGISMGILSRSLFAPLIPHYPFG